MENANRLDKNSSSKAIKVGRVSNVNEETATKTSTRKSERIRNRVESGSIMWRDMEFVYDSDPYVSGLWENGSFKLCKAVSAENLREASCEGEISAKGVTAKSGGKSGKVKHKRGRPATPQPQI